MFVFFQYKFYMSFESINSFIRRAHDGKLMSGCMQCDFLYVEFEERKSLRILCWRSTTAGISFHLRKQMLQLRRTLKRCLFFFTGCIWEIDRNIHIYILRVRERERGRWRGEKEVKGMYSGKWVISSHLSCQEALKYVYFYFKYTLLRHTDRHTHMHARAHTHRHTVHCIHYVV